MARKTGGKRFGFPLGIRIFTLIVLLVVLVAGGALAAVSILGERLSRGSATQALDSSQSMRSVLQQQRYRQLQLISRVFATDRLLTSYLAEGAEDRDPVSILDSLEEYQNLLTFDLAVVLDRSGVVLTRTDNPEAVGEDLSTDPLVAVALEEKQAFGAWRQGGQLYHAAALPLVRNFEHLGYIVAALSINDALARQVQRISGAEVVFIANSPTGPAAAASTMAPSAAAELITALRREGDVIGRVTQRAETADQVEISFQGSDWIAALTPLRDAAGNAVGASASLTSLEERAADYQLLQLLLIGLGIAALVVGLVFSQMLSRSTAKPLAALASAAEQAARGDFSSPLPPGGSGDVGSLRESLDTLLGELGGSRALAFALSRVRRTLPEPPRDAPRSRAGAGSAALLAVEMRRFAKPKIGYDPEENLARLSRDLQRVASAASANTGRLEAVFGHRALALFEGEGAAMRALSAAAEMLHVLSERESVFDEPEPPVVALAGGPVLTGSVLWGNQPSPAVAGLPIQQLESLMREAAPGDIYLSKPMYTELAETFQRAGVEVKAQRGLLSPQPLIVLSGELANRVTGYTPAEPGAAGFPGDRRSLADVRPGSVLGERYDVVAELGVGRMGPIYKARDRELGDLVVLKLLKPEVVADAARFERLRQVIQPARSLHHPNVLEVLDFGETDGIPYISCEYVHGLTLRTQLERGGRLGLAAGLHLARQLGWGLAAGHSAGLLHLGLKGENVLIEPQGQARLMDFGMAWPARPGTPVPGAASLAPEQLDGSQVDGRTDVYGLGAVFYEIFTGQAPYAGSSSEEVRQQHLMQDPAPPSTVADDIPPALEQLVARCLAKPPAERFGSVEELLAALEAVRS